MIKLLIIEDDAFDIMAFQRFFRKDSSMEINTALSIKEASEKLENNSFDLIISDFKLKDGDAFEIFEIKKNTPLVIVTGVDSQNVAVEALGRGAYDFVVKDSKGEYLKTFPVIIRNSVERSKAELKLKEYQKNLEKIVKERTKALESEIRKHKLTEKKLIKAEKDIIKAKNSMIFALATLAESRDNETGIHIIRIREYCKALTLRLKKTKKYGMQINKLFIENIFNTSVLHDIGKVGIPDSILLKPGKLSEQEFEIMKTHTEIGGRTLAKVYESNPTHSFLEMATDIVLHHHEKWNGQGYPRGISGEEISLPARITAFADIFDALMSKRTYKEAFPKEKTLEIMRTEKGVTLDPNIFPYFEELFEEFVRIFEEQDEDVLDLELYHL